MRNDSVIFMKGYGTRTIGKTEPIDEYTMFAIGSASKAFTAALAAMMVDAGKMRCVACASSGPRGACVVILTNSNGSPVPTLVLYRALDIMLGAPMRDWNEECWLARR